ncbi:acetate kinase [Deinococcus sonorensis]|uniref:Acetate kinase n=2 Tax=Deinococcus sonorensis TaxID=309891 RepID=A0AAU7UA05_9DEIO
MTILVLNAGSSSLKYQLCTPEGQTLMRGLIERIGEPGGPVTDHRSAVEQVLSQLPPGTELWAIGHRVVHGGERFREATRLTPEVLAALQQLTPLAPLHNPPALAGIDGALALQPDVPNVAVFDTAFHATLPPEAYLYALPYRLYQEHGLRRYGFHGTSHAYVARRAAEMLGRPLEQLKLVTLHLGNGASACAVQHGRSVDTSMGFTPLEGLVMGTRSGDLDPAVVVWLAEREGLAKTNTLLNRESGVLGLSGISNDLRDLHRAREDGDERATLALQVMARRIRKYVGAYAAAMDGLDAVVFTGGAGEHDTWLRAEVVGRLNVLGLRLDAEANQSRQPLISRPGPVAALVIPTDEEGEIALQTSRLLELG